MIYIYDIVLNLNKELIEYFEWDNNDNIKYIRKMPLYRINNKLMKDIITKNIKIDKNFLSKIYEKSEDVNYKKYKYLTLFTNDSIIVAVLFDEEGNNKLISRMLIEEEDEIIRLGSRITKTNIEYEIIENKNIKYSNLTREEKQIKQELLTELNVLYNTNKIDKLNYYYFEYFNKINNNKDKVYNELVESLDKSFNDKHVKLYKIIKLSSQI